MVVDSLELGAYSTLFKASVKFGQQRVEANVPTEKEKSLQKSNRSLNRENDRLEEKNKALSEKNQELQKRNLNLSQQLKNNEVRNQELASRNAERDEVEIEPAQNTPTPPESNSISSYRQASENPDNIETAGVVVNAFA